MNIALFFKSPITITTIHDRFTRIINDYERIILRLGEIFRIRVFLKNTEREKNVPAFQPERIEKPIQRPHILLCL